MTCFPCFNKKVETIVLHSSNHYESYHVTVDEREPSGSVEVLDLRPSGHGFEPHRRHYVVSLSKTH